MDKLHLRSQHFLDGEPCVHHCSCQVWYMSLIPCRNQANCFQIQLLSIWASLWRKVCGNHFLPKTSGKSQRPAPQASPGTSQQRWVTAFLSHYPGKVYLTPPLENCIIPLMALLLWIPLTVHTHLANLALLWSLGVSKAFLRSIGSLENICSVLYSQPPLLLTLFLREDSRYHELSHRNLPARTILDQKRKYGVTNQQMFLRSLHFNSESQLFLQLAKVFYCIYEPLCGCC